MLLLLVSTRVQIFTDFRLTFLSGKLWLNFFVEYIVRVNNFYMPFKIFALMGDHTLKIIFFACILF